mmetsp:Transcript_51988/g.113252  ORF Transcript_51988/g.113252 Transcript_51988/m.113252 type:complete len:95 (+) Transcript_51988:281-565(+)
MLSPNMVRNGSTTILLAGEVAPAEAMSITTPLVGEADQVVALPMFITIPLDGEVARATAPPTFIMVATATGITQRCTTTTDGVETLRRRDVLRL